VTGASQWTLGRVPALKGELKPPGDKSVSHRAAILAALASGVSRIEGFLPAEDCLNTVSILQRLGVAIRFLNEARTALEVEGRGLGGLVAPATPEPLYCGNSGTTMRLMLGVLAAHPFRAVLSGDESLSRRPMRRVIDPLRSMGATIEAEGGEGDEHAPLAVAGCALKGMSFELRVASAQVKSAILLAGLHASGTTRVREPAQSRDHTERQLLRLGAGFIPATDGWIGVEGGHQFGAAPFPVPGDPSAAAFFAAASAIVPRSEVTLTGVCLNHGRTGFLTAMERMGARVTVANQREEGGETIGDITVKGGADLKGIRIAGELVPRLIDELPVLAVLACQAEGVTVIRDAAELRAKESDRIAVMAAELGKMGAKVGVLPDGMAIEGGVPMHGAEVESHGDHRVAMALAVAALGAQGSTIIRGAECVATSYPGFMDDLGSLTGVK
jgi:3-phosphoshikimate 1-carboxyvinyltransferase